MLTTTANNQRHSVERRDVSLLLRHLLGKWGNFVREINSSSWSFFWVSLFRPDIYCDINLNRPLHSHVIPISWFIIICHSTLHNLSSLWSFKINSDHLDTVPVTAFVFGYWIPKRSVAAGNWTVKKLCVSKLRSALWMLCRFPALLIRFRFRRSMACVIVRRDTKAICITAALVTRWQDFSLKPATQTRDSFPQQPAQHCSRVFWLIMTSFQFEDVLKIHISSRLPCRL